MLSSRSLLSASLVVVAILASSVLAACGSSTTGSGGGNQATGSTCPTGSTLTYENFGKAFIQTNCLECHETKENPKLTSLATIQSVAKDIDREAASGPNATNTSMPEEGSVSTEDRKKLGEWLACGAP
ncbi:MAG: hypothetical protein U0169_03465 [Polyangiaceae bacterium]